MSNTTPESPNPAEPAGDDIDTGASASDADIANPPSSPVPARGHVNAPESAAETAAAEAAARARSRSPPHEPAAAAPAPAASTPAPVAAPEPAAAASDEDVAAAVARSTPPTPATSPTRTSPPTTTAATTAYADATGRPNPPGRPSRPPSPEPPSRAPRWQATPLRPTYVPAATPIYVTAPVPPKKKSNRGFGILIALAGTVVFALVYAAVVAVIAAIGYPAVALPRRVREVVPRHLGVLDPGHLLLHRDGGAGPDPQPRRLVGVHHRRLRRRRRRPTSPTRAECSCRSRPGSSHPQEVGRAAERALVHALPRSGPASSPARSRSGPGCGWPSAAAG